MDHPEYAGFRQRLEKDFIEHPAKYVTAMDIMNAGIIPDDEHDEANRHIMIAAHRLLKITFKQFQAALLAWRKEGEKQAKAAQREAARQALQAQYMSDVADSFGAAVPRNAREAVAMFCAHNEITVSFGRDCRERGQPVDPDKPIEDRIMLTAEGLGLTFGDTKVMTNTGIGIAWAEFVADRRTERRKAVWDTIHKPVDPIASALALRQLRELCDKLFMEPAFADAALRKFMWQVKRRMSGMYIEHLHFLVIGGGQGTGKTEFCRSLIQPIDELYSEASMDQVVDDKNFQLKSMFAVFVDELARADRADVNKVKTVVTGNTSTSRRLYSHASQKIQINITLLGTADKRIRQIINDIAGMRRFVEVLTKPKHMAERIDWEGEVRGFPWLALWQAIDHTTIDPLMSGFETELRAKQEDMRGRDNIESWLDNFDTEPKRFKQLQPKAYEEGKFIEIGAEDLYQRSFRVYEDAFHPGSTETSITSWGSNFKAMIEANKLPFWSWRKAGHKVYYRLELSNVVEMRPPATRDVAFTATAPRKQGKTSPQ